MAWGVPCRENSAMHKPHTMGLSDPRFMHVVAYFPYHGGFRARNRTISAVPARFGPFPASLNSKSLLKSNQVLDFDFRSWRHATPHFQATSHRATSERRRRSIPSRHRDVQAGRCRISPPGNPCFAESALEFSEIQKPVSDHPSMSPETLLSILRRLPRDRFTVQAIRMVLAGEMPSDELLRRCGIRPSTDASILGVA